MSRPVRRLEPKWSTQIRSEFFDSFLEEGSRVSPYRAEQILAGLVPLYLGPSLGVSLLWILRSFLFIPYLSALFDIKSILFISIQLGRAEGAGLRGRATSLRDRTRGGAFASSRILKTRSHSRTGASSPPLVRIGSPSQFFSFSL